MAVAAAAASRDLKFYSFTFIRVYTPGSFFLSCSYNGGHSPCSTPVNLQ
jgi:hypothetical protein